MDLSELYEDSGEGDWILDELIEMERERRATMALHSYPQPDRFTSTVYAAEELGEFFDAHVTRPMTDQVRNNDKKLDAAVELGDTISMVCTALLGEDDAGEIDDEVLERRIMLSRAMATIAQALVSGTDYSLRQALHGVADLSALLDIKPQDALAASHQKFYRKYGIDPGEISIRDHVEGMAP